MKILVVAPTPFFSDRGTHLRILEEALALEKLGHTLTIATYHIGRDINKDIPTKIDVRRILRLLFWYKKLEAGPDWQKIILDLMLIRKVFFLVRTQKPQIIHAHLHEGVLIGWVAQKIFFWRRIKLVSDFHGSLTEEMLSHGYLKRGLNGIFKIAEKIINRLGDYAVASSEEMTSEIKKVRSDGKIQTLLDGTNTDMFKHVPSKEEIRKKLELPQDKIIVAYTGGLVPNKGIGYFFDSIREILSVRKDIFFLIGGFPAEHIEKFLNKNSIGRENLRLVVPLNYFELPDFLAVSDIAIDPKDTSSKQASGKMLNYMSAGLPIVCFDTPNNQKYLSQGGSFARDVSGKALTEKILELAEKPEERRRLGRMNQERALEFSWNKAGKKLDEIYNQLILKTKK